MVVDEEQPCSLDDAVCCGSRSGVGPGTAQVQAREAG
jgi:hypothetical protein